MSESTALATPESAANMMMMAGGNNPFLTHAKAEGVTSGNYMRHNGNTGKFLIGDREIEGGSFLFDVMSARLAWLGFDSNNRPVNGPEIKMIEGKPLPAPPPVPGVTWNKQLKFMLMDIDSGEEILLSCKGDRPTRAAWRLVKKFGETVGRHPDPDIKGAWMIPVVEASSRSFEMDVEENGRKMRVKKYSDVYEITDWWTNAAVDDVRNRGADAAEAAQATAAEQPAAEGTVEILPPEQTKAFPPQQAAAAQTSAPQSTGRGRFGQR